MTAVPAAQPPLPAPHAAVGARRRTRRLGDAAFGTLTRASAVGILVMLAMLVAVLTLAAIPSIRTFGPSFIISSEWRPNELERPKTGPDGSVVMQDGEVVMET